MAGYDKEFTDEDNFILQRKEEQGEFESLLLGPHDSKDSILFPSELVAPCVQLLEAMETAADRYKLRQEQMQGGNLSSLLKFVESGLIVLYAPSEKENHVRQFVPTWDENSGIWQVVETTIFDWSSLSIRDATSKQMDEYLETSFIDRLVCFAEPIENPSDFKFICIHRFNGDAGVGWSFLPHMKNTREWYRRAKRITFPRLVKMCLFAIAEKSTREEWNARATDACCVAGLAIRSALGINRFFMALSKEHDRDSENLGWITFHLLRLVGTVTFDKSRYEKIGGGKTKPTLGIMFVTNGWTDETRSRMLEIRRKYSRMGSKPMLCPPEPHRAKSSPGGARRERLRRIFLRRYKAKYADPGDEESPPIIALNLLQETCWCINEEVLEYATKYIGKVVKSESGDEAFEYSSEFIERTKWDCDNEEIPWHDRTSLMWAEELVSRPDNSRFWHAWCFDWRGRMYSATNVLSPQGNDLSRGLIQFHEFMPVPGEDIDSGGPTALYWLKVNLVEVFNGVAFPNGSKANKRSSFDDRVAWINENYTQILAIAADPDAHFDCWWDDDCRGINAGAMTFRRLAAAFDFANVLAGIEAEGYGESRLPIQQDASSNWLQHTAMMLQDETLAKLSNIADLDDGVSRDRSQIPEDIYTRVTEELDRYWKKQRDEGKPHDFLSFFLVPEVNKLLRRRNVAKKPVMAVAYGGHPKSAAKEFMNTVGTEKFNAELGQHFSISGMIQEISMILKGQNGGKDVFPAEDHQKFVNQLMSDYSTALDIVAPGYDGVKKQTRIMQGSKPPKHIRKTPNNSALRWVTPSGFVVLNHKGRVAKYPPRLAVCGPLSRNWWNKQTTIYVTDMESFDQGASVRGAPPNFTHSIDASHMHMALTNYSRTRNPESPVALSMVHDSYGCHAANVNTLYEAVLAAFIEVHSHLPLDNLRTVNVGSKAIGDLEEGVEVFLPQLGQARVTDRAGEDETTIHIELINPPVPMEVNREELRIIVDDEEKAEADFLEFQAFVDRIGLRDTAYLIG